MFLIIYKYLFAENTIFSFLRLFKYLTFRATYAVVTAFLISIIIGPAVIRRLRQLNLKDQVRKYDILNVSHKEGTPTMGGLIILISTILPVLLWCDLSNRFIQIMLLSALWFGILGGLDDFLKLKKKSKEGLNEKLKFLGQGAFGLFLGIVLYSSFSPLPAEIRTMLFIPSLKYPILDLGLVFILFVIFVVVGISNSVNLADGLDGLAIVPVIFLTMVYGIFSYIIGNVNLTEYLHFHYISGTGELAVFCAALAGACVGFLWFNCYPATVFMGDIGALFLGGIIGTMCVLIKQELLFLIAGGIFVAEAFTVLVQQYIFIRHLGRRLFFRAPLHHTYQYRGLAETKVVVRLWIVSAILALIALSTIKIR